MQNNTILPQRIPRTNCNLRLAACRPLQRGLASLSSSRRPSEPSHHLDCHFLRSDGRGLQGGHLTSRPAVIRCSLHRALLYQPAVQSAAARGGYTTSSRGARRADVRGADEFKWTLNQSFASVDLMTRLSRKFGSPHFSIFVYLLRE